jgi:hypothetical protein
MAWALFIVYFYSIAMVACNKVATASMVAKQQTVEA